MARAKDSSALKSEFVANVSHELKTPLALVRMFAEMLQSGRVASEEKKQEYLDIIVSESERLSALIENVLDFARVERGRQAYELAEGSVGDAVTQAVGVYRHRAEREGVELTVDVEPGLPTARIDNRAIQLAIINYIDNAVKYAAGTGAVAVKAALEGGSVVVRVVNRGPGVPPEDRERIFERFVRGTTARAHGLERPVRGSGIGLALVKHIAESHGGAAWVEPAPGRGASFAFRIPANRPLPASEPLAQRTPLEDSASIPPAAERERDDSSVPRARCGRTRFRGTAGVRERSARAPGRRDL